MAAKDGSASNKESEAKAYDKLMDNLENQLPSDFNILNKVQPLEGCKVLDLGCGTGNYTYMLAERVGPTGSVIGVDPDKERIKIAREKWTRDNLTFMVGDGENFPEDQYDLIFSHYAIHWIKNKRLTFEQVYKNLRPEGQFAFVATYAYNPIGEEMCALMGPEGHQAIHNLWHYIPAEEYREILTDVGFKLTLIEVDDDDYTFPNVDVLLTSWHGITDGKFDTTKIDGVKLDKFKEKYGGTAIVWKQPVIRVVLVKQ